MARPKKQVAPQQVFKKIQSIPGLPDNIAEVDVLFDVIFKRFSKLAKTYGFAKVDTPLLEDTNLYNAFFGDSAQELESVVSFDAGGKQVSVRPTLLPSVLRAYVQAKVFETQPLSKWVYFGNTVRYGEKKQLASDYEFGFEVFGNFTHLTEAQVLGAVWDLVTSLGLEDIVLEINTIGKPDCQVTYQDSLRDFLKAKKYDLCDNCSESIDARALNVFRCNNLDCQTVVAEAPTILDFLDADSHKHFTNILEALDELQIPYQLNPQYVGKAGSGRTNCVVKYKGKGKSIVIGEGAYHEDMMQQLTGKNLCCFGFTGSLMRLKAVMEQVAIEVRREQKNEVFLVPLGELAAKKSLRLFRDLLAAKVSVYDHFGTAGVKNQLKAAEANKSPIALIMGQKEALDEMVILRDVKSGMQEMFSYDKIIDEVKKRLGK